MEIKMSFNTCLDRALIIDIDGTLYNNDHRKHFIEQSPKDWESFHANHIYDQPNSLIGSIISSQLNTNFPIILIFITGRTQKYEESTKKQIRCLISGIIWKGKEADVERFNAILYMRGQKDFRSGIELKSDIYEKHIKGKYIILGAFDDQQEIIDLWNSYGIFTIKV